MSAGYAYRSSGRTRTTAIVVAVVWLAIVLACVRLDASVWLMGIVALCTVPALWDLVSDRPAGLSLDPDGVRWFSGRRTADVAWNQIDRARFDTRLDFSVRVSFLLVTGRKLRVPFEATPPHETLEAELAQRGVKVERHHFSLLG